MHIEQWVVHHRLCVKSTRCWSSSLYSCKSVRKINESPHSGLQKLFLFNDSSRGHPWSVLCWKVVIERKRTPTRRTLQGSSLDFVLIYLRCVTESQQPDLWEMLCQTWQLCHPMPWPMLAIHKVMHIKTNETPKMFSLWFFSFFDACGIQLLNSISIIQRKNVISSNIYLWFFIFSLRTDEKLETHCSFNLCMLTVIYG